MDDVGFFRSENQPSVNSDVGNSTEATDGSGKEHHAKPGSTSGEILASCTNFNEKYEVRPSQKTTDDDDAEEEQVKNSFKEDEEDEKKCHTGKRGAWRLLQNRWLAQFRSNPLALSAMSFAVVLAVFGLFKNRQNDGTAELPPPLPRQSFPEPNFNEAEKNAVTDAEAKSLLMLQRKSDAFSPPNPKTSEGTRPAEKIYTAEDMAAAVAAARSVAALENERQPARRRVESKRTIAAPVTGAHTNSAPAQKGFDPRWFVPPPVTQEQHKTDETQRLRFAPGARIPVVLDIGISSSRHGIVLARSTAIVTTLGGQIIPVGSVFKGSSSSGNQRIFIDFSSVNFDGKSLALSGIATAGQNVGIPAVVVRDSLENRSRSRIADGAIETLKGVVSVVGGPLGEGLARGAGGALSEAQHDLTIERSVVLEVASGARFEIVVTDG